MAIKKYHRNIDQPDYVSRSQIKQEAQSIKQLAIRLVELTDAKLALLPLSETSLKGLQDFKKMTSNLARKRHLMYVAKCLRKEDQEAIESSLDGNLFKPKSEPSADLTTDKAPSIIDSLVGQDSSKIEAVIESLLNDYPNIQRQTLRQLVRNINNAKDEKKKQSNKTKLCHYLGEHLVGDDVG
ncbi:MAG: ribosome biogenesis factor YjgA [Enterobacterales bacterium]|nr:ribosome biogenesis factor YjgA [Enterobacterales bacterium]